ncbi:pyridoxamine 5'-phosphate oxidase-domain-containing protein [Lipomyces arxii]|uniref:pyridoxamine 5'-phosphate oxidase-domain-containing protein n=1 Tax=Lipomyces arxii TaxID=56418 RepID=UPI0034CDD643
MAHNHAGHDHSAHNLEVMSPPWVSMFRSTMLQETSTDEVAAGELPPYPFTLATVSTTIQNDPLTSTSQKRVLPHARICMLRGFAGSATSGILVTTTDKRMLKYAQLSDYDNDGVFEACFWFAKSKSQYRMSGASRLIVQKEGELFVVDPTAGSEEPASEDYAKEFNNVWDNLSTSMKLSFIKPPPGTEFTQESIDQMDKVSQLTDDHHAGKEISQEVISEGKKNFVLVLLLPEFVDYVNVQGVGQRVVFSLAGKYEWIFHQVCP